MKKILSLILAVAMVLSMGITAFAAENDVVILYTNDVHTYIDGAISYDNIAALKTELDAILVDAGDHIQGTAYGSMDKGETIIKLMNAAGYDVATLGNHEFDYGMEGRIKVTDEWAEFPYVSANFYHEENGVAGDPVLKPYEVIEKNGVKIAFVGITTPESFTKSTPAYFQDAEGNYIYGIAGGTDGQALYDAVQVAIDAASAEADYVIALGHLGDDKASQPWTSEELIANTTGLDAFIDGHSHSTVQGKYVADEEGNNVLLTQTGEYFDRIGKMTISDGVISTEFVTEVTGSDEEVKAIKDAWMSEVDTQLGVVIGNTGNVTFDNYDAEGNRLVRKQETNTGDFCADALYYLFDNMGLDVDVAIMNGGGVRNKAISGDISYKTCKEIHTFGNVACLQTITGQQLLDALEWGAKATPDNENGGFLHVSGITYEINTAVPSTVQADEKGVWVGGPTGEYRVQNVMVGGEPLDLEAEYNLAGYNYTLRDLGDGFAMFDGAVNVLDYVMEDYMVLANYVKSFEGGIIPDAYIEPQGRITLVEDAPLTLDELKDAYAAPADVETGWNPYVKEAIDDFIATYGGTENAYVVFDFDNTTSIFDVEEQLAVYQLQVMAFAFTPEEMPAILATELGDLNEDRTDLGYGNGSYNDWIYDITAAYTTLYNTYGPFTAAGLDEAAQAEIQADPIWAEFATKMRAMYDLVYDAESPAVAYPWVLYWFTGMTEQEVYDLAYASHSYYGAVESEYVTWTTAGEGTKVGAVEYEWTSGTGVSAQLKDLYKWLDEAGIDVWVCSASAIDPIRAAIDAFGLHDYVTGVIAMARTLDENGKYVNSYDYETGYGWQIIDGEWVKDNLALGAQTQGVGKVTAINNAIMPKYDYVGPLAGFMDSTGDYNFCTEYDNLKLVINFNRASRKVTDGGGVIAELAIYQRDYLGYTDLATANAAGDTYYVLQGRDERGLRSLAASDFTWRLGKSAPLLFREDNNFAQLLYMINNEMTTEEVINTFAVKTSADDSVLGFKYGFVADYAGYHNIENGELDPLTLEALKAKYTAPATLEEGWNPYVKQAIDDFIATYGGTENAYVVFDFDNTTSIFDVEEQLAVYQLQVMAFAFTPEEIENILFTELGDHDEDRTDLGYGNGSYQDWVDDIEAAYTYLYNTYGPFDADGLDAAGQAEIQADPMWAEFATKMRAMYDLVYDAESPAVAYPWVLYWFTGMTEQEVYDLAYASHSYYGAVESEYVTWTSPEIESKVGVVEYEWTSGTGVSKEMQWLYKALDEAGIDVWVCSASAIDPIRAAIDAFGLHDYVTGVIAMVRTQDENGKYVTSYDYETGYGWFAIDGGEWVEDDVALGAQTQGVGKVTAINNVILPKYDYVGPLAGFMDSTGDYNFCTEYANLKLVINFNRASRKVTDGGGVIAELAIYQRDYLGYDSLAEANAAGDTYYVIQGRQENGLRGFLASDYTLRLGKSSGLLFREDKNFDQLLYMIKNDMTTEEIINMFALKTSADDSVLGFKYGFLADYAGYHNIENGELDPSRPAPEKPGCSHDWGDTYVEGGLVKRECADCGIVDILGVAKTDNESNPSTGAPVLSVAALIALAAAAVSFKK